MTPEINVRDNWNRHSPGYQQKHLFSTDYAHYFPFCPNENDLRLLGNVWGKHILEIGCGGGQCSIAFAKQGAHACGIDISDAQIEYARQLAKQEGVEVRFIQGDIVDLSPIADASQDIVFSAGAMGYVDDIHRCLAEVYRALKPGGQFVFSWDHPFRDCFWDHHRITDGETSEPVYSYFNVGPIEWKYPGTDLVMRSYHWRVEDWFHALRQAGFIVEEILEPPPVFGRKEDIGWDDMFSAKQIMNIVPHVIIFAARKPR